MWGKSQQFWKKWQCDIRHDTDVRHAYTTFRQPLVRFEYLYLSIDLTNISIVSKGFTSINSFNTDIIEIVSINDVNYNYFLYHNTGYFV